MTPRPPWRGRTFSVRARITATVALLTAGALTGAGLLVYLLGVAGVQERVRDQVDQEMSELAAFREQDARQPRPEYTTAEDLVYGFLLNNVAQQSELYVGYYRGAVRASSQSSRDALAEDPGLRAAVAERAEAGGSTMLDTRYGRVYLDVQPVTDAGEGGAFAVAYFVDDEREPLGRTMRTYAVAALLALAVVTAVAAWQAGRLLAPVRTLRENAEEIGETDLSRRIPETGNDDITDLTRTVNAMLARLEHAFAGQREFLDDAGHELRTPLTILRGHLELLDRDDPLEVDRTRELLLDEVDRMSGLVDDLIMLTKADRPDFFTFAEVEVAGLVDRVAGKVRALGDRDWQVESRPDVVACLDEQRLTQALVQLAHNAVKHTSPGDTVALGADVPAEGRSVRLWVRDTGPGVPDALKTAVFARFVRGESAPGDGPDTGFGLGLSIVAAIAAGHAGSVWVEDASVDGRRCGARFVIEVPIRRSTVSTGSKGSRGSRSSARTTATGTATSPASPAGAAGSAWPAS